jgi:hypothetical protein
MNIRFVLPFLLLGAAGYGVVALAQTPGTFTATGSMTTPRSDHTATLLADGQVLVAGGCHGAGETATAELYDPERGTFAPTGDMTIGRCAHTATLLPDGRVLIVGRWGVKDALTAELYDPSTGTFTATGSLLNIRGAHQAILLGNGKVLISGGYGLFGFLNAELYDPATGMFAASGPYSPRTPVDYHDEAAKSALLAGGQVLIVFATNDADLYDPFENAFTRAGKPAVRSYENGLPTVTTLLNGKVLVAGGAGGEGDRYPTGAELYDPRSGSFTPTGSMITSHVRHTATLLPDGTVLMGFPNAEIYNPMTGTFTPTGDLISAMGGGQATLLPSGQVLVTGGYSSSARASIADAEIYHPAVLLPAPSLLSVSDDGKGQGAIYHPGTAETASAENPATVGEALEIYCFGLADGGVIPPQVAIGGLLAEILFFGNPAWGTLNQINVRVPEGVVPGPAVPVRLTYLNRPSNEVTIGVR